jgi:hypothetical protein
MATKTIPNEIKQQADAIVSNFNKTVIQDPENFYVTRYRGLHLYLDRYNYVSPLKTSFRATSTLTTG